MRCPLCNSADINVKDSRGLADQNAIRRRRECNTCGHRFTTFERIETATMLVVKKTGERAPFDRDKILRGIVRSAEKRPIPLNEIETAVDNVVKKVYEVGENEIATERIGDFVMEELIDLDEITYIRFASVYRQFKDMTVFLQELQDVVDKVNKDKK
ncbi:MAG: transcriptional regulator NrdR [Lactobacillales bacterium]|jgi:transcriptional repressor NrdR|nr:transcriptional regulator NrdR [Lactobacillales bacterium]